MKNIAEKSEKVTAPKRGDFASLIPLCIFPLP
jgi:hypothetical protein